MVEIVPVSVGQTTRTKVLPLPLQPYTPAHCVDSRAKLGDGTRFATKKWSVWEGGGGNLEPLRNMANTCHSLKPILCLTLLY